MNIFFERSRNFTRRFLSIHSHRNNILFKNESPIISFTFDDFPASAAENAGLILNKYRAKGTFYASLGLMGKKSPHGIISNNEHINQLIKAGHEIGDHTYDHPDAMGVSLEKFEYSIIKNRLFLKEHFPDLEFSTFAYPYGHVVSRTKNMVRKYYKCSRSTFKGINYSKVDLNLLKSHLLFGDSINFKFTKDLIDQNRDLKGWLIFFTHDVEKSPSGFGCSLTLLEDVIKYSIDSGLNILSIKQGYDLIQNKKG